MGYLDSGDSSIFTPDEIHRMLAIYGPNAASAAQTPAAKLGVLRPQGQALSQPTQATNNDTTGNVATPPQNTAPRLNVLTPAAKPPDSWAATGTPAATPAAPPANTTPPRRLGVLSAPVLPSTMPQVPENSALAKQSAQPQNPIQPPTAPAPMSTKRRVLGALFSGMGAFKSPELGQQIYHNVFEAPGEKYQREQTAYDQQLEQQNQDIDRQRGQASDEVLRGAQANEANARADALRNPPAKVTTEPKTPTPEEQAIQAEGVLNDPKATPQQKQQAQATVDAIGKARAVTNPPTPRQGSDEEQAYQEQLKGPKPITSRLAFHREWVKGEQGTGTPQPAGNPNLSGDEYLASLPPAERGVVRQVGEGRLSYEQVSRLMYKNPALSQEVAQAYPGFDATQVKAYQEMRNDFARGKTAQNVKSLNMVLGHLKMLEDQTSLGATLPGISFVNRKAGLGNAAKFHTSSLAVATELAAALKGGTPSKEEIQEWKERLDAWTPGSEKDAIQDAAQLVHQRLQSTADQWDQNQPNGWVRPHELLSPQGAQNLKAILGNDFAVDPRLTQGEHNPPPKGSAAAKMQNAPKSDDGIDFRPDSQQ